jgi:L-asparaginase
LSAPGVFVAMNGQLFAWDRVQKNKTAGVFESR